MKQDMTPSERQALLVIHIEPDRGTFTPATALEPEPWLGFERAVPAINRLREELSIPLRVEWLLRMDPHIGRVYGSPDWAVGHYARLFETLFAQNEHIGVHVHSFRFDEARQNWVMDMEDQQYINDCISMGAEQFGAAMGKPALSIAMGNHQMSQATLDHIQQEGFKYDISTVGARSYAHFNKRLLVQGSPADFSQLPTQPYQPQPGDYQRTATEPNDGLWLLPLSSMPIRRMGGLRQRLRRQLSREGRHTAQQYTKFQLRNGAKDIGQLIKMQCKQQAMPYIALECRTNLFNFPKGVDSLKSTIKQLKKHQFVFKTAAGIVQGRQKPHTPVNYR